MHINKETNQGGKKPMRAYQVSESFRVLEDWEAEESYFDSNFDDELYGFSEVDENEIDRSFIED